MKKYEDIEKAIKLFQEGSGPQKDQAFEWMVDTYVPLIEKEIRARTKIEERKETHRQDAKVILFYEIKDFGKTSIQITKDVNKTKLIEFINTHTRYELITLDHATKQTFRMYATAGPISDQDIEQLKPIFRERQLNDFIEKAKRKLNFTVAFQKRLKYDLLYWSEQTYGNGTHDNKAMFIQKKELESEQSNFQIKHNRVPTNQELLDIVKDKPGYKRYNLEKIILCLSIHERKHNVSIDQPAHDDNESTLGDTLSEEIFETDEQHEFMQQTQQRLLEIMKPILNQEEHFIMDAISSGMTHTEILNYKHYEPNEKETKALRAFHPHIKIQEHQGVQLQLEYKERFKKTTMKKYNKVMETMIKGMKVIIDERNTEFKQKPLTKKMYKKLQSIV